jgi:hypothetical protein
MTMKKPKKNALREIAYYLWGSEGMKATPESILRGVRERLEERLRLRSIIDQLCAHFDEKVPALDLPMKVQALSREVEEAERAKRFVEQVRKVLGFGDGNEDALLEELQVQLKFKRPGNLSALRITADEGDLSMSDLLYFCEEWALRMGRGGDEHFKLYRGSEKLILKLAEVRALASITVKAV